MPNDANKEVIAVLTPVPTVIGWLEDIQGYLPQTEAFTNCSE
jgi:hypothetical protein